MYDINLANRLSQALLHFVIALAEQFTDHKMSGLSMRAKKGTSEQSASILLVVLQLSLTVSNFLQKKIAGGSGNFVQLFDSSGLFRRISLRVLPRRRIRVCGQGVTPSLALVLPCLLRSRIRTSFDFPQRSSC